MSAERELHEPESDTTIESRYDIERVLGQGSAGIVYRVRDRQSGERLALKKLLRVDPKSVQRLKHEFRALADLHHPNLIKLYDLGHAQDAWYITMEYLRGVDLLTHVRAQAEPITSTASLSMPANQNASGPVPGAGPGIGRICSAFVQLAHGIEALHRAGMLHRDLKPRNVMVETEGERVVVLDFGLVRELGETAATITRDGLIAGTPAYMAPEQIQDVAQSDATDWYAFGVMLYEALSGVLPIDGTLHDLLRKKLQNESVPIEPLPPQLPRELNELCMALLQRDPQARPGFDAIVGPLDRQAQLLGALDTQPSLRLGMAAPLGSVSGRAPGRKQPAAALFGREAELERLAKAFESSKQGTCVVAHVRGATGSGKSALVEHYLESLEMGAAYERDEVLVLRARCHEREAMPFKALDGLLDTLTAYLERMDSVWVSHVLPMQLADLARAFPVLERLPAARKLLSHAPPRADAAVERANAELALREMLRRIAARQTLVLFIDDLQWGDLDSVRIIKSWLEAEEPFSALLVLGYRSDEQGSNGCLQLLAANEQARSAQELFIDLAALPTAAIEALCAASVGPGGNMPRSWIERIASEAGGSPLLATQLSTLAQARLQRGELNAQTLSIRDLVAQLTALLQPQERRLLDTLAVAGRPVELPLALRASGLGQQGSHARHAGLDKPAAAAGPDARSGPERFGRSQLHALQSLGLTRARRSNGSQLIEVCHDRIRAAVVDALSADRREELHRSLLRELMASGQAEPDWLYMLAAGANEHTAAARYLRTAAERAAASLAFERAAELYQACLRDTQTQTLAAQRGELSRRLGDALAACGRGTAAADAYLQSAQLSAAEPNATTTATIELKRLAATHLIRSGHFARGEALVREVLTGMRIRIPRTHLGLLLAIVWERVRLALRGLGFKEHKPEEVDPAKLHLATAIGSLSIDTQAYDPVRAALFEARAMHLALELGDRAGITNALCLAATTRGVSGSSRDERYAEHLLDYATQISEPLNDPLLRARISAARAMLKFLLGKSQEMLPLAEQADQLYSAQGIARNEMAGEYYHRFAVRAASIGALFQLGRVREASAALRQTLQQARATENRTAELHLAMVWSLDEINHGLAARARARLDADRKELPAGFGPLHLLHMVGVMRVACALQDFGWANAVLKELWPRFERSIVKRSILSLLVYSTHARMFLNEHVVTGSQRDPRPVVQRDLRALRKRSKRLASATGTRCAARLAYICGERDRALQLFRANVEACSKIGYGDELERARWAIGRIVGGEEGEAMCAEAVRALGELGFQDVMTDLRNHYPELIR